MQTGSVVEGLRTRPARDQDAFTRKRPAGDRVVYTVMAELVERWGKGSQDSEYGFSRVGAVTGATYPSDLRKLRKQMPHTFFLVPGYGAQGGTAEDVAYAFDPYGRGAIVNSSRGIMCAWQKTGNEGLDYGEAARQAALTMRDDIRAVTPIL